MAKKFYNIDTWLRLVGFAETTGLIILCVMFNKSSHWAVTGPGVKNINLLYLSLMLRLDFINVLNKLECFPWQAFTT
jgi:hypothetical protein